jgi:3-dehydroquinate synthase class II
MKVEKFRHAGRVNICSTDNQNGMVIIKINNGDGEMKIALTPTHANTFVQNIEGEIRRAGSTAKYLAQRNGSDSAAH